MNREIKFRGKDKKTGKWMIGSANPVDGECHLSAFWLYVFEGLIDPPTVGQYTGLKDKNGVELYEGDIIRNTEHDADFKIGWGIPNESYCGFASWCIRNKNQGMSSHADHSPLYYNEMFTNCIFLGDIHTNPDLLEKP